jgi:DNA-binding NtrC family response regulator
MTARVLFLDDEEPMCDLVSGYFRQKGFGIATATTGRKAMELATMEKFDVAIFDIHVANENGLELLSYFKNNFPQVPVIMLTGMVGGDELIEQARLRGASGFMRKTDSLDDLFSSLKAYLPEA